MRRRMMKNQISHTNSPNQRIHIIHAGHHTHELWSWAIAILIMLFAAFVLTIALNGGHYIRPFYPLFPYT